MHLVLHIQLKTLLVIAWGLRKRSCLELQLPDLCHHTRLVGGRDLDVVCNSHFDFK